jgi:hypothetical protein
MKEAIDTNGTPVYKLSWKYREEENSPESISHYLLESVEKTSSPRERADGQI